MKGIRNYGDRYKLEAAIAVFTENGQRFDEIHVRSKTFETLKLNSSFDRKGRGSKK